MKKKAATGTSARKATPARRKKVLFFCACNSIRSQMAEGIMKAFHADRYEAYSAGIKPAAVHPVARQVMAEIGIDISGQSAKGVEVFVGARFACVAMVCGDPKGPCPFQPKPEAGFRCKGCATCCTFHPFFPKGTRVIHGRFPDLSATREEDNSIEHFRRLRDELKDWIEVNF